MLETERTKRWNDDGVERQFWSGTNCVPFHSGRREKMEHEKANAEI